MPLDRVYNFQLCGKLIIDLSNMHFFVTDITKSNVRQVPIDVEMLVRQSKCF